MVIIFGKISVINKKYILFIDDIQSVLKSGSKDKDTDISNMISDILTEGDVRVIGTTTFKEVDSSVINNRISEVEKLITKLVIYYIKELLTCQ